MRKLTGRESSLASGRKLGNVTTVMWNVEMVSNDLRNPATEISRWSAEGAARLRPTALAKWKSGGTSHRRSHNGPGLAEHSQPLQRVNNTKIKNPDTCYKLDKL